MKAFVVGVTTGEYQGNLYGRIHSIEPVFSNGTGRKCVIYKVSPVEVVNQVKDVDKEYDLVFNQYGRVVEVRPL